MMPSCKEQCHFWDGKECHYEMLFLGCNPCGYCPPDESEFTMPDDVRLPESPALLASEYVRKLDDNREIKFRGTQFPDEWSGSNWTTADARAIFTYGLALCDEIDNPPRVWVTGDHYLGDGQVVWRREENGWSREAGTFSRHQVTDDDVAFNTKWLDSLVHLVPENDA